MNVGTGDKYGSDCPLTLTAPLSLFEGECTAVHGAREVAAGGVGA